MQMLFWRNNIEAGHTLYRYYYTELYMLKIWRHFS
jgi:hypothetical protein